MSRALLVLILAACGASTAQAPEVAPARVELFPTREEMAATQKAAEQANGARAQAVPIKALSHGRSPVIYLPWTNQEQLAQQGVHRLVVLIYLCVDEQGVPERMSIEYTPTVTGLDKIVYDQVAVLRFEPYIVDRQPVPVCTVVTNRYEF